MKTEKRAQQIREKIERITADKTVITNYNTTDNSVQAELRLSASWKITVPVDEIHYPKSLGPISTKSEDGTYTKTPAGLLWHQMGDLAFSICKTAELKTGNARATIPLNARLKNGVERRIEAKNLWMIEIGKQFLADYRTVTGKKHLATIRAQITDLQTQQKALLPKLRESNSIYLADKKTEREEIKIKNAEAIKTDRFWEADKDTLKGYFHPPFDKNYLADVSEKWRATLFLECKSISYKWGDGNWGHKLGGTGRGYLCGIDDNGDEWGHRVENLPQSSDNYGNAGLDSTVEEAMSNLFDITQTALANCQRQGDLLFCAEKIGTEIILTPEEKWTPRESHEITSPSLQRNGRYFRADHEITVSHTSHPTVILPPGEYRLYALRVADAD